MVLEGKRVILRPGVAEDLEVLWTIHTKTASPRFDFCRGHIPRR
jgi:hypothetical protein